MQRSEKKLEKVGFEGFFPTIAEGDDANHNAWKTGVERIDACLPSGGLSHAGLHEVEPLRSTDMPSLTGFSFGLLARLRSSQPIIWCVTSDQVGDFGQLYAHGVERYGISPAQIIFAKVNHPLHLHFAMEEALKTDGVAAVIGEGPRPTFVGSRRLSMLCKTHNRPCLLLNAQSDSGRGSAALTRWQIAPCQGEEDPLDPFGPGLPTWRVALPRVRSGRTMPEMQQDQITNNASYPWRISWDDQTHSFRETSLLSHRTVSESPKQTGGPAKAMVG
ncbi:ImuA family protein [Pseudahrensia aquimaris]|uniref:ImuA family protein n=1 Tax=Pseudahrensia aquimaris TaxID=744461 RepID=A0ABW3FAD6_9HYPH